MKKFLFFLILNLILLTGCAPSIVQTTPPPYYDPGIDPNTWTLVPAGEFLMGLHEHETNLDYNYEIMVTDVTNTHYAGYLNDALAAGTVKIVDDQIVGYYPGDEFHAHEHEMEIKAGDWLHITLEDPGLRLDFDGESLETPVLDDFSEGLISAREVKRFGTSMEATIVSDSSCGIRFGPIEAVSTLSPFVLMVLLK